MPYIMFDNHHFEIICLEKFGKDGIFQLYWGDGSDQSLVYCVNQKHLT